MALSDNLVAYYKCDDGSGTTATDATGNGHDGTLAASGVGWTGSGKVNGGLTFSGSGNGVVIPDSAALDGLSAMTIAGWYKPTSNAIGQAVSKNTSISTQTPFETQFWNDGNVYCNFNINGNFYGSTFHAYTAGAWVHVVQTYDSATKQIKMYINGSLVQTVTTAGGNVKSNSSALYLGSSGGNGPFNGLIDEVAIWSRALSGTEISTLYNGGSGVTYPLPFTGTATQPATARIAATVTKTQSAIGRIAKQLTKTQAALGRVANIITKTQAALARVATKPTKTQSAKAMKGVHVTPTWNEITDGMRYLGLQGDGQTPPGGFGIWKGSTNLNKNGGFENSTNSWFAASGTGKDTITRDNAKAKFGSWSLKVTTDGTQTEGAGTDSTGNLTACANGTVYSFSAWVWVPTGMTLNARIKDNSFSLVGSNQVITGNNAWQRVAWQITGTASTATTTRLYFETSGAGTFWVDGVQQEQRYYAGPYIDTNGSTASRSNAAVTAPSSLLNGNQGWFAARVVMGWSPAQQDNAAAFPVLFEWQKNGDNTTRIDILFNTFNNSNTWTMSSRISGSSTGPASAVQSFNPGDHLTIIGYWNSSTLAISVNGSAFSTTPNTKFFVPDNATFLVGGGSGNEIDSAILWAIAGTDATLSNSDAAAINAYGDTPPSFGTLLALKSSAANPSFDWPAVGDGYLPYMFNVTQPALARIANALTKTQAAVARVAKNLTKTQSSIARIANLKNKTQTAVARIAGNLTKTQTSQARIAQSLSRQQPSVARISQSYTKTQPAIGRVANTLTFTQHATARIKLRDSTTVPIVLDQANATEPLTAGASPGSLALGEDGVPVASAGEALPLKLDNDAEVLTL